MWSAEGPGSRLPPAGNDQDGQQANYEYVRNGTDIHFQCVQHWGWVARALLCKSLASV
jgi:hypothetical protein